MDQQPDGKMKIESFSYLDGVLIEHKKNEKPGEWKLLSEDAIYQNMLQNKGIGTIHSMYIEVNEIQDKHDEYKKILKFLKKYIESYAQKKKASIDDIKLEFINYGKTELVYVLTEPDGSRITLLVKQPAVPFGSVYEEMQNLLELKQRDSNVIAPIDYFQLGSQELYVTPYLNQARCVASYGSWGMYIPEPFYRFEPFTKEQESVVNTCMISKLVSLYDFDKHSGIACCKLGGGDFMLPKGWENEIPTIENTFHQLYLIAARKKICCAFEEYLQIIREEFSKETIHQNPSHLKINLRGRVAMQVYDIEAGIHLGKQIIDSQNGYSKKRK